MTALDGEYTREMKLIHTGLRREYRRLPALVRGVEHGDTERARMLADHIVLLNTLVHRHHTGEDEHLWPKLLMRVPEELVPVVNAVERQHEGIDIAIQAAATLLPDWCDSAGSGQAAALADALDLLATRLGEHLHLEEEQVVPLIEEHITASEWSRFVGDGARYTSRPSTLDLRHVHVRGRPRDHPSGDHAHAARGRRDHQRVGTEGLRGVRARHPRHAHAASRDRG